MRQTGPARRRRRATTGVDHRPVTARHRRPARPSITAAQAARKSQSAPMPEHCMPRTRNSTKAEIRLRGRSREKLAGTHGTIGRNAAGPSSQSSAGPSGTRRLEILELCFGQSLTADAPAFTRLQPRHVGFRWHHAGSWCPFLPRRAGGRLAATAPGRRRTAGRRYHGPASSNSLTNPARNTRGDAGVNARISELW